MKVSKTSKDTNAKVRKMLEPLKCRLVKAYDELKRQDEVYKRALTNVTRVSETNGGGIPSGTITAIATEKQKDVALIALQSMIRDLVK